MSDLKKALEEAGLDIEFGQMDIAEFDPLCKINCTTSCTYGCSQGCIDTCQPGMTW